MAIQRKTLVYEGPEGVFESILAFDSDWTLPRPGVLLLPNVLGLKEADSQKAEQVAALGYVALATDIYGQGKRTTRQSPNPAVYMNELGARRDLLRDRLHHALGVLKDQPRVDAAKTAALGFCFGGKCTLDMARSGADLLGVVSYHGVYDRPSYANVTPIKPKVLVCHGWDDPIAPPDATVALGHELTEGGADWQIHAYGNTGHGFTDKDANMPERKVMYQPDSDRRSWKATIDFLAELFG